MSTNRYRYTACFIDKELFNETLKKLDRVPLSKEISRPHVTLSYMPEFFDDSLLGEEVLIHVIGYGNDGNNEGLLVQLETDNPGLKTLIDAVSVPHITLSISEAGEAVNTRYIDFKPIDEFVIKAKVGGILRENNSLCFAY